jgi:hypothetical protein
MDTEVPCVIEKALLKVRLMDPVGFDLFGDRSGVLAEVTGDILKRTSLFKGFLDIDPVIEGQVFLDSRYVFAHVSSFHCCQKENKR